MSSSSEFDTSKEASASKLNCSFGYLFLKIFSPVYGLCERAKKLKKNNVIAIKLLKLEFIRLI